MLNIIFAVSLLVIASGMIIYALKKVATPL